MAFLREGFTITFIGSHDADGVTLGDKGRLLAFASDHAAHVQWLTGIREGQVTLTDIEDIDNASQKYAMAHHDDLADSLEMGSLQTVGARSVYDIAGPEGTLVHMASQGQLGGLAPIADGVLGWVCTKIRTESAFMSALAGLDPDEQEEIIQMAACTVLRDTFGGTDDD
jgi:hypothetical protein